MKLRAVRLRNLFFLVAVFATIVALGSWENRRNMQHVLGAGYRTVVEITGAQYQRLSPIAIEGWRPRFVEQNLSVNLKWEGKDGRTRQYRNVPVTETFADSIVSGNQIKLAILPAKVLDDELSVPVIMTDAAPRLTSLQEWLRGSVYVSLAGWFGFAAMTFWIGQERRTSFAGSATAGGSAFPLRRLLFGMGALAIGAVLAIEAWSAEGSVAPASEGPEIIADITAGTTLSAGPAAGKHVVQLAWKDPRGGVHHFGPVPVSETFWNKIAPNGELTVRQARIRAEGDGADARPVIIDDLGAHTNWRTEVALVLGLGLLVSGVVSLLSAARTIRPAK